MQLHRLQEITSQLTTDSIVIEPIAGKRRRGDLEIVQSGLNSVKEDPSKAHKYSLNTIYTYESRILCQMCAVGLRAATDPPSAT